MPRPYCTGEGAGERSRADLAVARAAALALAAVIWGCGPEDGSGRAGSAEVHPDRVAHSLPAEPLVDAGLRGPVLGAAGGAGAASWSHDPGPNGVSGSTAGCAGPEPLVPGGELSIRAQVDLQRIRRCARRWWWS